MGGGQRDPRWFSRHGDRGRGGLLAGRRISVSVVAWVPVPPKGGPNAIPSPSLREGDMGARALRHDKRRVRGVGLSWGGNSIITFDCDPLIDDIVWGLAKRISRDPVKIIRNYWYLLKRQRPPSSSPPRDPIRRPQRRQMLRRVSALDNRGGGGLIGGDYVS